jgi:hypothetical protein
MLDFDVAVAFEGGVVLEDGLNPSLKLGSEERLADVCLILVIPHQLADIVVEVEHVQLGDLRTVCH